MKNRWIKNIVSFVLTGCLLFSDAGVTALAAQNTEDTIETEVTPQETSNKDVVIFTTSGEKSEKKLSMDEIRNMYHNVHTYTTLYQEKPEISMEKYSPAVLTADAYQTSLDWINYYRNVAGVSSIEFIEESNDIISFVALVEAANYKLTSYPVKPITMDDETFNKGASNAKDCNLAISDENPMKDSIDQFMYDSDLSNIADVEHRRKMLNPYLLAMGIGTADAAEKYYTALAVGGVNVYHDKLKEYDFISWPASGNNLSDTFSPSTAWSVSLSVQQFDFIDPDKVKVKLTQMSDGTEWNMDASLGYCVDSRYSFFNCSDEIYGIPNTIIFRPSYVGIDKFYGDYKVEITGVKTQDGRPAMVSYTVTFDSLEGDPIKTEPAKWIKSGNRWWYRHADGSYTTNNFERINGKWYYFDNAGWMVTGWKKVGSKWYYFGGTNDGSMKSGWQKVENKWYYLGAASDGSAKSGWQKISNNWYYFNTTSCQMMTGWQKIDNKWYYFGSASDGSMKKDTWIGNYYVDKRGVWIKDHF